MSRENDSKEGKIQNALAWGTLNTQPACQEVHAVSREKHILLDSLRKRYLTNNF